ncbi:MAG TPA: hydrolase [Marmoricola sp.]|nr:hydrolase [Marmoricola sp.]
MTTIETPHGAARVISYPAAGSRSLVLTHGAGSGIEAVDLQVLADHLPPQGISVHLVELPWVVAGKKVAPSPRIIDESYAAVLKALALVDPVIGGRSAGARSACRISTYVPTSGVLALSFPLHPPGKPEQSRLSELDLVEVPPLVVQGESDSFGRPSEFPSETVLTAVPGADHAMKVAKKGGISQEDALALILEAVLEWMGNLPANP